MQTLEPALSGRDRRRFERFPCPHYAQTFHGTQWSDCAVEDISAGGAAVASMLRPAVGAEVMLFVEDVAEMPGVVVRHTEAGFALRFQVSSLGLH